jgi:hypothetical protein
MMEKRIRSVAILVVGVMALGLAGLARAAEANQPPERMTYQGYLVDANGDPLGNLAPVNYVVIFRIYDVKQGGASLWAEQQTVTVDKGYFSVMLGEGSDFGNEPGASGGHFLSGAFSGAGIKDRFIGVTVKGLGGSDVEIAPRLRLVSSPYAYTATHARRLTDESGNPNFFKEGSSLKLGAGETPTLTLPDAGGATLVGALTADLAGWGTGLQVDNGNHSTTFGGIDLNAFNLSTSLARFSFNKPLEASSISFSPFAGLAATSGTYGSVMTTGSGANNHEGYSIGGRYNFMTGAESDRYVGTYNDLDDKWLWLYDRDLDRHIWHSDGGQGRLVLSPDGLTVEENLVVKGSTTFHYDLNIGGDKYLPRLIIDSTSGGDEWTAQGAAVSIGEGAASGNAATMHMSYRGDGYGWVGAGSLGNGEPSGGHARFNYLGGATVFNRDLVVYSNGGNPYLQLHSGTYGEYTQYYRDENAFLIGLNGSSQNAAWRYVYYNGDSNWDFGSDRRHKENIKDIEPVLGRLLDVQIRRFKWKGAPSPELTDIGVIAQELEPLFPGLISKTYDEELEDDALSVGYTTFGILAVKGLQELKAEKDEQLARKDERIKALEERLARLEELVGKMGQQQ